MALPAGSAGAAGAGAEARGLWPGLLISLGTGLAIAAASSPARAADALPLRLVPALSAAPVVAPGGAASLTDLARAALERASAYTVARAEVDAEAARRDQVRAAARPSLSAEASLQRQRAVGAATTAEVTGGDSRTALAQLALRWTLLDAARDPLDDAAGLRVRAAEAGRDQARTDLLLQVLGAYLGAAVADQDLALTEQQIGAIREQAARSGRRLAAGVDSRLDALEVEATLEALNAELARQRGELAAQRATLQRLCGALPAALPWLRSPWPAALHERALALWAGDRRAATLLRQQALAEAAQAQGRAAERGGWPTLALSGSVGRLQQNVDPLPASRTTNTQIGLQLLWPIDLDGARRALRDEAQAGRVRERAALDEARSQLEGDFQAAAIDYERARRELEAQERAAELARETVAATLRAYIAGLRSGLDLLAAHQREVDARRASLRTRASLVLALARASALAAPWEAATLAPFEAAFVRRPE